MLQVSCLMVYNFCQNPYRSQQSMSACLRIQSISPIIANEKWKLYYMRWHFKMVAMTYYCFCMHSELWIIDNVFLYHYSCLANLDDIYCAKCILSHGRQFLPDPIWESTVCVCMLANPITIPIITNEMPAIYTAMHCNQQFAYPRKLFCTLVLNYIVLHMKICCLCQH